jgi:beta-lactamase class A
MKKRILISFATVLFVLACFPSTYSSTAFMAVEFQISTADYMHEALPRTRQFTLAHRSGLFENVGDTVPVRYINPQVISIIEQRGNRALINTWFGELWVDLNFSPPANELDDLLQRHGNNVALLFHNIETGFTYTYNEGLVLFGASLNKINHALYVYALAERGYISMETVHTYTENDRRGGTGRIQHMAVGTRFTTRELLYHSIQYSCNVAYRMLIRHTQNAEFSYHDFVAEMGANPDFIGNISSQNTNVRDKLIWMTAVHNYINSGSAFSAFFREDLFATPGFFQSDYPIARKYGWATNSFHEAAIIYADSPYILIVLSNYNDGAMDAFATISRHIQEFNRIWFCE